MLPEELDVSLLAGLAVIEVGCRQAWPFLALIDQRGEREVRLYFDTDMRVEGEGGGGFSQEDAGLLAALGKVLNCAIERAHIAASGDLRVDFSDGYVLEASGQGNSATTVAPWWFGLVSDPPPVPAHRVNGRHESKVCRARSATAFERAGARRRVGPTPQQPTEFG
ncbi:hypothetical protein [Cellulomonas denverensis]|uniref:Uncharacterized protein n=1 Tax=Cellulomonas denverensis TaxID=264297 RepID=A0A7X6QZF0_9CELL|nr:hypothetical protein [Cellulomonas denverensis]NKY23123.1 hypothetical protein [Cellulomonas denverensis]GIG23795.1 hypothetical protein Cde04nite_00390 [Cellulomonas denverensis]